MRPAQTLMLLFHTAHMYNTYAMFYNELGHCNCMGINIALYILVHAEVLNK